jgi:hypothetical protein
MIERAALSYLDKEVADDKKESVEKGLFTNRREEKESVVDDA